MVDNRSEPSVGLDSMKEVPVIPYMSSRYLRLARKVLARGRLPALMMAVARKSGRDSPDGLREKLKLLLGLCAAWWKGEYRAISGQALLSMVAGLIYFVVPLDVVPDWLLGVGLLDDLAVLGWVMRTWSRELEAYRKWRETRPVADIKRIEALPHEP